MATSPPVEVELNGPGASQAIPPEIDHEVHPTGTVTFVVEFHIVDRTPSDRGEAVGEPHAEPGGSGDPPTESD
jgi:hypothetical protein